MTHIARHGLLRCPLSWAEYLPSGLRRMIRPEGTRHTWRLQDGTNVSIRTVSINDGPLLQEFVRNLSAQSRYQRFFYPLQELTTAMLDRFTQSDPHTAMTLLAVIRQNGRERALAMAQYAVNADPHCCDFGVVVADEWQGEGIGTRLMQRLIGVARSAGIIHFEGDLLPSNAPMQHLMAKLDFEVAPHADDTDLRRASKVLGKPAQKCAQLKSLTGNVAGRRPISVTLS